MSKPTHVLKVMDKTTNYRTNAGVAWKNDDDSITIVLNPCVTLSYAKNIVINLFPLKDQTEGWVDTIRKGTP